MSDTDYPLSDLRKNDIFISYSNQDIDFAKKLDAALRYQHRDPWIDWEDLPLHAATDAERQQYVKAGIEDADIFVLIVSLSSLLNENNIAELKQASIAKKRLVAILLAQSIEIENFINCYDLVRISVEQDGDIDFKPIARKIIHAQIHTKLVIRAEEWTAKNHSEDLLLQGRDLVAVQKWAAQKLDSEFELQSAQKQYLEASTISEVRSPKRTDSFISYSRRDQVFVEKLYGALRENQLNPWVDWRNIPVAADWWEEIKEGIETAHTFVFIVSPDSVVSPYCHAEVAHAIKHGKRFISVDWREVSQQLWEELSQRQQEICIRDKPITIEQGKPITVSDAIETLRRFQWHRVRSPDDFSVTLQELLDAIQTDLDYVRRHTRLLLRALEWKDQNRSADLLLRGEDLRIAEQWLASSKGKEPHPTLLQEIYIQEGSKAEAAQRKEALLQQARFKSRINLLINLLLLSLILGISSFSLFAKRQSISTLAATFENPQGPDRLLNALALASRLQKAKWIALVDPQLQTRVVAVLQEQIQNLTEFNQLNKVHTGTVYNVSFSPDMQQIASASEDGSIGLWSVDGQLIKLLTGHQAEVVSVAFDPTGAVLASGSRDGTVKLWGSDGALLRTLTPPSSSQRELSEVIGLSFSPGGQTLAVAYKNGSINLWTSRRSQDWAHADHLATLQHAMGEPITSVSFSRYSDRIATSSLDGTIKLWTAQGQPIATTMQHDSGVLSVSFSPDDQAIASADFRGTLKLWTRDGELIRSTPAAHEGIIHRVVFSPHDGRAIASVGADGAVKLWNRENGELLHALRGHQAAVYRVQFSPDGRHLASAGADDTIKLWSVHNGTLLKTLEGHRDEVLDIDFSWDVENPILISAGRDRTVRLWNLESSVTILPHNNRVFDVSFSPDGKVVASSSSHSIRLWQPSGIPLNSVRVRGDVLSLNFSPNSKVLASGGRDDAINLWQFDGSRITNPHVIPSQQGDVLSLDFSPEGQLLASAGEYGTVKLWRFDGKQATLWQTLSGHRGSVLTVRFAPDNELLASAGTDGEIKLWRFDGTLVRSIAAEQGKVNSLAFRPDGVLASAGEYGSIKLWRPDGVLLRTLEKQREYSNQIFKINFSQDGKLLAAASENRTIDLWTIEGDLITTLERHSRQVHSVAFSPDSRTLASASFDNRALLWKLPDRFEEDPLGESLRQGCRAASDYLSSENTQGNSQISREVRVYCSTYDEALLK